MALPREVVELLRAKETTRIALVGASNNPRKYGKIILADLVDKGFTVLPVNDREDAISGLEVRRRVSELEDPIHIVNFVVPPQSSLAVLEDLDPERFPVVWFQPGAFDRTVVEAAKKRKFRHVIAGDCIMVET